MDEPKPLPGEDIAVPSDTVALSSEVQTTLLADTFDGATLRDEFEKLPQEIIHQVVKLALDEAIEMDVQIGGDVNDHTSFVELTPLSSSSHIFQTSRLSLISLL